jgi:tetratricopeptide (TPR) repeat protein
MDDMPSDEWTYVSEVGPDWDEASQNMISCISSKIRKYDAIDFGEDALQIALSRVGEAHKDTVTSYANLAFVHYSLEDLETATIYADKVLEIAERHFGLDSLQAAQGMDIKMCIFSSQDRYDEAIELANKLLRFYTRLHGSEHHETRRIDQAISDLHEFRSNVGKTFWQKYFG